MDDDRLNDIAAEITRQNAAFAEFERDVAELGDAELRVPTAFLDELDSLATPGAASTGWMNINGVRA